MPSAYNARYCCTLSTPVGTPLQLLVVRKTTHFFILLQFLRTLTSCYNNGRIVYRVNLQILITHLTYVLLLEYLRKIFLPAIQQDSV